MHNAFKAVVSTENPKFKDAYLDIEVLPVEVHYEVCNARSTIENPVFQNAGV